MPKSVCQSFSLSPPNSYPSRLHHICLIRQHCSGCLGKSPRIKHSQASQSSRSEAPDPVQLLQLFSEGQLHPRPSEHVGGCSLQGKPHSVGRCVEPDLILTTSLCFRTPQVNLCPPRECTSSNVQLSVSPYSTTIHDALSADWNTWETIYLFPPPALVPTCLWKLRTFSGHGIFVVPGSPPALWCPELLATCSLLYLHLLAEQLVRAVKLEAQERMSLTFIAFLFWKGRLRLYLSFSGGTFPYVCAPDFY